MTEENNTTTTASERVLFQMRMTVEEKVLLEFIAKEAGMNMSDFARFCFFNKPPRKRKATFDREIMITLISELGRVASNVNQIAKAMNMQKKNYYSIAVKETLIAETLATVQTVSSSIYKQINYGSPGQDTGERQPVSEISDHESGQ